MWILAAGDFILLRKMCMSIIEGSHIMSWKDPILRAFLRLISAGSVWADPYYSIVRTKPRRSLRGREAAP